MVEPAMFDNILRENGVMAAVRFTCSTGCKYRGVVHVNLTKTTRK